MLEEKLSNYGVEICNRVVVNDDENLISDEITKMAKSGDVIITLGAGDISSLGEPILQSLASR